MTDEWNEGYKEGLKIGMFIAIADINYSIFKDEFEGDVSKYKRRINWLSYYEQRKLKKLLVTLIKEKNDENLELIDGLKKQIKEYLR